MLNTLSHTAEDAAGVVADYFRGPIGTLESLIAPLADTLAAPHVSGQLTAAQVDVLVEPFADALRAMRPVPVYGAGFIAAVDRLRDARSHLAWWQGEDWRKLVLAVQTVNKERIDYRELEWYRVPETTGRSHVAGPYVDYLCSDEYTITIATPVRVGDDFLGVLAFDLLIDEVEQQLTPRLDALGIDVTLVNGVGRVVISTDPRRATGDSVRGEVDGCERVPCEGVALDVLVSPRRAG